MSFYHPCIMKLDSAASDFHQSGMMREKNEALRLAGVMQQELLRNSPYDRSIRCLDAQWTWALGHLGLLHQLVRWFRHTEPNTRLLLETNGASNPYFLQALAPYLMLTDKLPDGFKQHAMFNAVYFGCPDGVHTLSDFYKIIERECEGEWLLCLGEAQKERADELLAQLGVKRPYVAIQKRKMAYDPARNVGDAEMAEALLRFKGWDIVRTDLDGEDEAFPSVMSLADAHEASFLLSAGCDHFIGGNSGAWVIPHAYQRPVTILGDKEKSAWIYPL